MVICLKCEEAKQADQFEKDKSRETGRHPYCKSCRRDYSRKWREDNQSHIKEYNQGYYENNKEGYKRRQQRFREDSTEKYLLGLARRRARRTGIDFSLNAADVVIPDRCPVLGIELQLNRGTRGPNSPSLDRIKNTEGYVVGNVVVISVRANELKKDATIEEILLLADFYGRYAE